GRGRKRGRAVIQTMTSGNEVITCAAEQDYDRFYRQEIILRQLRTCAPFRDQFRLTASGAEEHAVLRACLRLRQSLERALEEECYRGMGLEVLGPAPASVAKVNNQYRYRLSIMGKNSRQLRQLLAHLLRAAQQDRKNAGVSIYGDLNPLD
ncbi:MAG: primosomal protein N', partial [Oscillospiraceae bacterium]|nr:primosomal protein N' [Oscillospiraceae bacterium]